MDNIKEIKNQSPLLGNKKELINKAIGVQDGIYQNLNLGDSPVEDDITQIHNDITPSNMENTNENSNAAVTYFHIDSGEDGFIEFDLSAFRQKGEETRFLSIKISGLDIEQEPAVKQVSAMNINSKEEFEAMKAFFAQLDWND